MTNDTNLPAITEEHAVPAVAEATPPAAPVRPRPQNVTTGLFPLALAVLIIVFVALAIWTLMTTTGGAL